MCPYTLLHTQRKKLRHVVVSFWAQKAARTSLYIRQLLCSPNVLLLSRVKGNLRELQPRAFPFIFLKTGASLVSPRCNFAKLPRQKRPLLFSGHIHQFVSFFFLANEQVESERAKEDAARALIWISGNACKKVLWPRFGGALIRRLIPAAGMDENKTQQQSPTPLPLPPPPAAAGPSDVELKVDQNESDNGSLSGMRFSNVHPHDK